MIIIFYLCSGKVCLKSITIMLLSINPQIIKINEQTSVTGNTSVYYARHLIKTDKKTEKTAQNCHLAHS